MQQTADRLKKRVRESISLASGKNTSRGTWTGRFDFLLSCIGYAVGLGTIWRFPYICYRNGGGAFLVPYVIYMILLGMPLVLLEMGYGQFSSLSPIAVWKISPLFQGVGMGMVVISAIVCVYYNVIIAWTLYYLGMSFAWKLPWSTCDNSWNTESCSLRLKEKNGFKNGLEYNASAALSSVISNLDQGQASTTVVDVIANKTRTASEEFWEHHVLGISSGIENMGAPRWQLVIALVVAWVFIFLCLCKGVKTSGKVVYVTATLPYILLVIFLIRGVTLPGAIDGIRFYIIPDWQRLLTFKPWAEASQQLFYSMGAAWGALITMASYNKFNNNFYRDAVAVSLTDTFTAFLSGFVIFSTIGFMAQETGSRIDDVVTDGPGLVFIVLPEAIAHMPGAPFWAVIFFVFIFTVGIDSQFGMFETVLSALFDQYPTLRGRKVIVTAMLCVVEFLLGLPCITNGGIYFFQIMDWYCSTFSLMVLSLLECVVISWIYGVDRYYDDMKLMLGFRPNLWWSLCWRFVTPVLILFVLITSIALHTPVTYGKYVYPSWAIGIGWMFSLCSLIPIPILAIIKVWKLDGPIRQRISQLLKPAKDWGPAEEFRLIEYQAERHRHENSNQQPATMMYSKQDTVVYVNNIPTDSS